MLYPAYASYKAVKTKNIREYVSSAVPLPSPPNPPNFGGPTPTDPPLCPPPPKGPLDDVLDRLRPLYGRRNHR